MFRWVMIVGVSVGCGDEGKQVDTSTEGWSTSTSQPSPSGSGTSTGTGSTTGTGSGGTTSSTTTETSTTDWWGEACDWEPCGGDPKGQWESVLHCAEGEEPYGYGYSSVYSETTTWSYYSPAYTTGLTSAYGECDTAFVTQDERSSLVLELGDTDFSAIYRYALDAAVTFPAACVTDPSCLEETERIAWALADLCGEGCAEESYGCTPVGGTCHCEVSAVQDEVVNVPYTIDGTRLVLDLDGVQMTYEYCVDEALGMTLYQPDEDVTAVLVKAKP